MNDRTNRTLICSIAYLDIVGYSQRVGQEQLLLKERFSAMISEVIKGIAQNDRVLIDTGDGAALCFMGDPEDALFVVMSLRDHLRTPESEAIGLKVRIGINLGPVRMINDINNHQNVIGDGINVAQRVMSFAAPNEIMVSRTYFEVVSRLSHEFTKLFHYAGARTDKHVREHEVYQVGSGAEELSPASEQPPPAPASPPPAQTAEVAPPPTRPQATAEPPAPKRAVPPPASEAAEPTPKRRSLLVPGAIAAVVVLAIAIFAGTQLKSEQSSVAQQVEAPTTPAADSTKPPASADAGTSTTDADAKGSEPESAKALSAAAKPESAAKNHEARKDLAVVAKPEAPSAKGESRKDSAAAARTETQAAKAPAKQESVAKAKAAGATGKVEFWVSPFGDVVVDGKSLGSSPPLKIYELPAGPHRIEIFNDSSGFPYKETIEVKAGETTRVNASFRSGS